MDLNSSNNTAIGNGSGYNIVNGSNNTAIGNQSGNNFVNGNNNSFLGVYSGFDNSSNTYNNSTAVGSNAKITSSNQIVLGTSSENVNIPGTLNIQGTLTTTSINASSIYTSGTANIQGGLKTTSINASSIYTSGTANIQGELTTNGIYNSNTTSLQGQLTINNSTTISGVTTITNTNNSTSVNTGALIVQGGLGLSKNMKNTGTIYSQQLEIGSVGSETYSTTIIDSSGVGIVTTDQLITSSSVTSGKLITTNIEPPSGSNLSITSNGQTIFIGTLSDKVNITGSVTISGTVTSTIVTNLDVSNSQILLNTSTSNATAAPPAGAGIYVEGKLTGGEVYPKIVLNSTGQWVITNLDNSSYNIENISNIVSSVDQYVKIDSTNSNVNVYSKNLNINPTTGGTQGNLQILSGNLILGGTSNTLVANSTTGDLTTIGKISKNNNNNSNNNDNDSNNNQKSNNSNNNTNSNDNRNNNNHNSNNNNDNKNNNTNSNDNKNNNNHNSNNNNSNNNTNSNNNKNKNNNNSNNKNKDNNNDNTNSNDNKNNNDHNKNNNNHNDISIRIIIIIY